MKRFLCCWFLFAVALRASELQVTHSFQLSTAITQAQPGDIIVMQDGAWADADILFSANGTASHPVTLRAQTLGRVQLTGQSRLRISGNHLVVDGLVFANGYRTSGEVISFQESSAAVANHCRLINCSIIDYNPPDMAADTKWVGLYGASNRVEYCYFRGKTNAGTTLVVWVDARPNTPNYHVISRNYFGFRPALGVNGGESIRIGTSDVSFNESRTTVEENYFERCNGDAEIISSKSLENTFRHNTFVECEGSLCLRHGNGSVVEGNYFFGNHKPLTGGVRIIGDDHTVYNNYFVDLAGTASRAPLAIMQGMASSPLNGYFQVHRATVAFNTFVNCTNAFVIGLSGTLAGATNVTTLPPIDCVIANNIVSQPAGKIIDQRITPENLLWQGNIFFGATLGITTNDGTSRVNPLFAMTADGLWRPSLSSPALGNAQGSYNFATNDFEGDVRSSVKDIGCDQLSAAAPIHPPLTTNNVGPSFMRVQGTLLTWAHPEAIAYGTSLSATQLNASANAPGVFAYDPPAGTILNVGTGQVLKVIFTPNDLIDFNVVTQTVTIEVFKGTPVITWANPAPLSYDTPLGRTQLNASANVPGDFIYAPPSGTLLDVSNNQTLTVTFTPSDTNNYDSATRTASINVGKGTPQIVWSNPAPIEQGTPLSATQLSATANASGNFAFTPPLGTILAGGTYTLTAAFNPSDATRYNPAGNSVTLDVTLGGKRVPKLTWAAPSPLLFGAPLSSVQLNAVASVAGRFVYAPPAGSVLPAGNAQMLTVAFTPDDEDTFTSVTNRVPIDIATRSSNAILRVAYIIPSNRTAQAHAVDTLRKTLLLYQNWLAVQMERNGFGPKTFTLEMEADGATPFIHVLPVSETDSFLRGDAYGGRVLDAARAAGLPVGTPEQIWWLIPETHIEFPDGGISGSFQFGTRIAGAQGDGGWTMLGSEQLALLQSIYHTNTLQYHEFVIPEIGPFPLVDEVSFPWFEGVSLSAISSSALGSGLHSLGEALGLDPDYRNDENFNGNVMGYGFRGIRGVFYPKIYPYNFCALSHASALALDVNPFLNPGRLATDITPPTLTMRTTGEQTPVRGLLQISFDAADDKALHAALLTWERDSEMRVVEEVVLSGLNASQSFSIPYFDPEVTNRYAITVFDRQGNRRDSETLIYPRATFNRSPQPFIIVRPLVAGIGQDIVMDASETFDSEGGGDLLEIEWDLDGDGNFDTDPTTSSVFTNQYLALGTHVIRARMTDPAGAVAISAPVAVNITICPTALSPLTRFHGFAGSSGSIDVIVGPKCQWTVSNTNDWITLLSDDFGSGPGTVIYNVLPNPIFAEREGTLLIGDERFVIRQHAVECNISLSPTNRFHGFGTGGNSFKVTTKDGCAWQVVNTNSWITITSGASGVSTGTVSYVIGENRVFGRRSGNLVVGTDVFTVNQWGTNCDLVLNSTARNHSENSETGSVTVTTASGCPWLVQNTNAWLTVLGGSGTNTANFSYVVAPNPAGASRTGIVTINGQIFTVSQRACSYTVSPLSRTHSYLAQSGSVTIGASSICPWTVINTNDWLAIESGLDGVGSGHVTYQISQNPRGEARAATVTVAGQIVTVIQSGKPCLFTIGAEEAAFGEDGGVAELLVSTESGCPWTVASVPSWITIISGATGEGSGNVIYFVAPNTGGTRNTTLVIGEQDFSISQASAVRTITAGNLAIPGGQTNCLSISMLPHGGENTLAFSICIDTNLLRYRSAKLQAGTWANATLNVNTSDAPRGRIGFTIALPPGTTLTSTVPATVQVCLSALVINGRASTPVSFCDAPVARRLVDVLGRALPTSFADASADVLGLCSLAESLEADFNWQFSSANAWRCQTNVTHDGFDAGENAPVADGGEAYFESTFVGPGTLSFWWKVSSEPGSDRLRLYLDGNEQFRISGEVDWEWRSLNLSAGSHNFRWRYSKNSSITGGLDRGWVDEIVYVPTPPAITSQPANQNADEGGIATFAIGATGQGPFSYQWLLNGIALSDGTLIRGTHTATLTLSNVLPAQAGLYSVIVGNIGGSVASAPASLNVIPAVLLGDALEATNLTWTTSGNAPWFGQALLIHDGVDAARSGSITHNQTASFETTVSGPGTLTFWWKVSSEPSNDRLLFFVNSTEQMRISGEVDWEQRTFSLGAGTQTLGWTYLKNGSISSGQDRGWVDQVQVAPAPVVITAQPLDQNLDPGATAMFAASASGAPALRYQWQRNGVDIPGAAGATLTVSNVSAAQSGTYAVLVSNPAGGVFSSNALLQVTELVPLAEALDAPSLTWTTNGNPPWVGQTGVSHDGTDAARSGRIGNSQTNSFQTTVVGPGTLSFWWKVSSETNDRLRLVINGTEQASTFGEVDWTWRLLPIGAGNQIIEWRYTKNNSVSGGQDRGWVDEIIFVATNTPTSPVFAIQPVNRTVVAPASVSFSAIAVGSAPLTYQWLFNGAPLANGVGINGVTATNIIITNASGASEGTYAVVAANSAGSVTSSVANLSVITAPVITSPPASQNLLAGGTANFILSAIGTAPLAYQWQLNETNLVSAGNLSGVTSTNFRITNVGASNIGSYSVVITNAAGSVTSAPATLVISTLPTIVTQPTNRSIALGGTATFSATAAGSAPLSFQWRFNGVALANGGDISGATSPTLQINNVQVARGGPYSVVVSNAVGNAPSANATLTVLTPPVITSQPISRVVLEGTNVTFTVSASGAPLTFRWRLNGTNLIDGDGVSGTATAALTLANVQPEQSGVYSVEVSNTGGSTLSVNAQLIVVPKLNLGDAVNAPYLEWTTSPSGAWIVQTNVTHDGEAAAQSGAVANGSNAWIQTRITGPGTLRFWWKVSSQTNADLLIFSINGVEQARISGIVDWEKLSIPLPPGDLTLRWSYNKDAIVTSGLDRGWLDEVDFIPNNAPTPPLLVLQPVSLSVNPGVTVTFSTDALGTAPVSYQWRFEGQNLGDDINTLGANSPTLRLFNVRSEQSGLYDVTVRNAYGLDISTQVFLSVFKTVSLPIALDTDRTNLLWFTGGYSPWIGQTVETKDQFDAAQSSPVANRASNWVQTTLPVSCALTFWWKVSSETNHDYLRFLINGAEQARISGEVGWQQRSIPISTNGALLRWEYNKDASGSAGRDRGWLDRLEFLAISPEVTNTAPNTNIVEQGTTTRFRVEASGTLPLTYQWRKNGSNLTESATVLGATTSPKLILSNAQPDKTGFYICEVANEAGSHLSEVIYLRVNPSLPLAPALNTPAWVWETGGYSWWIGTTSGSHDGTQCARPGYTDDGHTSWMRTTLTGPGTVSFWWRASTQLNADFLKFKINDIVRTQISGTVAWQQKSFTLGEGPSVLQWEYAKDALLTNGTDQVFVDEVAFAPAPPLITNQPPSQLVDVGSITIVSAGVRAVPPVMYRWRYNGVAMNDGGNISGATTPTLRITAAQLTQSGAYSLLVSNIGGIVISSNAQITVAPVLPLAPALDTTNIIWATGTPPWIGQTNVTHDGVDAARSPAIGDNKSASMQATVTGPGNVAFWWRTSSELSHDFLTFSVDNNNFGQLSGEAGWQQTLIANVPEGDHVLRWTYSKDAIGVAGQDRGWVDQFSFTPTVPRFTLQPVSLAVEQGERATFSSAATGYAPFNYQWRSNGVDIRDGAGISGARTTTLVISNAQLTHSAMYSLCVSNPETFAVSSNALLTVTSLIPLSTALDIANLVWTTNGSPPWVGQMIVSHDDTDAARSGAITNNGSNAMQSVVIGPGTLSFWWKVSSETNNDRLTFTVNNVEQARISGEVDWQVQTFSIGSGSQVLRWAYAKNATGSAGRDRGWVDEVVFGLLAPAVTAQPANQNIDVGGTASFRVTAIGAPPLTYQWQHEGVNIVNGGSISGASSSNLVIAGAQPADAGNYRVVINGGAGNTTSTSAVLKVLSLLPLAEAVDNDALSWTTVNTAWTGHGLVSHDGLDAARSGTIGNSGTSTMQTTVTGPGTLTFWWKVSSETNNDVLLLFIGGTERARISGETDWRLVSMNIGIGTQVIEWRYTKNGSTAVGQDRAWVDEVRFGVVAPTIGGHPASVAIDAGETAGFSVSAAGTTPFGYRWLFNGQPIGGATNPTLFITNAQVSHAGSYSVVVSNSAGSVTSLTASLTIWPSLAEALDAPQLTFTTGGTGNPWSTHASDFHDGEDAAASGTIGNSTYTWIKTTVNGPGVLTFWWQVSSEQDHDFLRLMMDGNDQVRISGEIEWQPILFNVPSGAHEIQWRYSKNSTIAAGQDRAWVDEVSFTPNGSTPATPQPPRILFQPVSQIVDEFETVDFSIVASGTAPLHYRWFLNGTNVVIDGGNVGGATTSDLTLFNVLGPQAGNYSVVVSNSAGSVTSLVARLTINHLLTLEESMDAPDLPFTTDGNALWEGHAVISHDGVDAARSGIVSDSQSSSMQTLLNGPGMLSFWWKVSSETNSDVLVFSVNDIPEAFVSGEVDWEQRFIALGSGPQFLEWTYFKNTSGVAGDDRAWVDQLSFTAEGAPTPAPMEPRGTIAPIIRVNGEVVQLRWDGFTRRAYKVEYKDDLSDPEWTTLDSEVLSTWRTIDGTLQSDIYTATIEDGLTARTRFYRVLEF